MGKIRKARDVIRERVREFVQEIRG
jgi:hypothetical protein